MKNIKIYLLLFISIIGLNSCNYLDIVPDEREKEEDAFKDPIALKRYLYSCYSFIPKLNDGASSLDLFTGDEVITSFEHESFANFPKGNFTAANPIISYWNTLFSGIRQCYMLREGIDQTPGVTDDEKKDYIAQTDFLIAYYHLLLMRCYGPVILIKELPDVTVAPENYASRSTLQETVEFITSKFQEAANNLPNKRENGIDVGLATSTAALALKEAVSK